MHRALAILLLLATPAHAGSWTGRDKVEHFAGSAALTLSVQYVAETKLEARPSIALPVSVATAIAIGVAKEVVHDHYLGRGNPSHRDMIANILGVGLATLVIVW